MKSTRARFSCAFSLALLFAGPFTAQAVDPTPAEIAAATSLKQSTSEGWQQRAKIIRRIADEEFRGSDRSLDMPTRLEAIKLAQLSRTAERQIRPDGLRRAQVFGILNKCGLADQTEADATIEANAYQLTSSLKNGLAFLPKRTTAAELGPDTARTYFGQDLAAYAETLPPENRCTKLRSWISERLPKLPQDSSLAANTALSDSYNTKFNALTGLLGDVIAGLEAAELLVQLEGYTAEAHAKYAEMLARNGQRSNALRSLDIALALDPKNERALQWEKQLADYAPELYTGVVEEIADARTLAMLSAMALMGESPKGRDLLTTEAAARTMGRRIQAALRAPADRREAAVKQAVALHEQMKNVTIASKKADFMVALTNLEAAKTAADAKTAFDGVPLEVANRPLYWQARSRSFLLENKYRDVLDNIYVMLALDSENAWAKKNRVAVESAAAKPPAAPSAPATHMPSIETHSVFYTTTMTALRQGDYATAEAAIAAAYDKDSRNAETLLLRARAKLGRQDQAGAEADLVSACLSGGPLLAEARGQMALLRFMQRRLTDAGDSIALALALAPDQPDALLAQAHIDTQQKNPTAALEKLTRALAVRPDFEEAIGARANLLIQTGKAEEGMQLVKGALVKNPQSLRMHVFLASQYLKTGKLEFVRQEIAEIAKLKDPHAAQMATLLNTTLNQVTSSQPTNPAPVAPSTNPTPAAPRERK